jgi:hypothetical protein
MSTVNLVPLGLGELLDQTFSTFRKHFWLFAGIMAVPQGIMAGLSLVIQIFMNPVMYAQPQQSPQAAAQTVASAMHVFLAGLGVLVPYFVLYVLALGASTYALSETYLGRTTTIRQSYRVVLRKFWKLLFVIISVFLRSFGILMLAIFVLTFTMTAALAPIPPSMVWVPIVVGLLAILGMVAGGVLVVIFLMRYSVAVPALVLEKISARQAIKRSVALTKGYLWRLLIVGLLMAMIYATLVALCQSPFTVATVLITVKGGQPSLWLTIPNLLLGSAASIATAPLFMISFAIAYYDLRVRKEGFDLQLMMSNLDQIGSPASTPVNEGDELEDNSVWAAIVLTVLTGGIYQPIWFLRRRRALNKLNSPEKIGVFGLLVALVGFMGNVCIPLLGSFVWGSSVQAENKLGPIHPAILLVAQVIIVVQCFKVRRILLDHLAPKQEGMFSRMGTFFLGIFYLQHKINGLLDRLTSAAGGSGEMTSLAAAEYAPPPMIS